MSRGPSRAASRRSVSLTDDERIAQSNLSLDEKMAAFERLFPTPLPAIELDPPRITRKVARPAGAPSLKCPVGCSCSWACDVADFRRRANAKRKAG